MSRKEGNEGSHSPGAGHKHPGPQRIHTLRQQEIKEPLTKAACRKKKKSKKQTKKG